MKRLLLILPVVVIAATGCALVPTDFMPKPVFIWSREFKEYKQEKRNYRHMVDTLPTNSPAW